MISRASLTHPVVAASILGSILLAASSLASSGSTSTGHWQVTGWLVGLLSIATAVRIAVLGQRDRRRRLTTTGTGAVGLRQTLDLGEQHRVHVIELDGRVLLIGESGGGLALLGEGPWAAGGAPEEDADPTEGVDLRDTPKELRPGEVRRPMRSLAELRGRSVAPAPPLADFKTLLLRERARSRAES